ncbi:MAG: hypothetical protein AB8H80_13260 [Planctomycetota bacterium]
MSLLLADLRALGNLPTSANGRRALFGMLSGLFLLALMSWWLARSILESPRLLRVIVERSGDDPMLGLCGYGLMTCPMVATWLGLATAQRQLFETPEMMLWRQAPIAGWRGPVQILIRALAVSLLWSSALAGPFLVALLQKSPATPLAYVLIPLAILCCTAPLLALLLGAQIIMVRVFAGRWLRLVLTLIASLASVVFTVWLLLNLFTTGRERLHEVEFAAANAQSLPATVHSAASMLAAAATGRFEGAHLHLVLLWLVAALGAFGLAALLHTRAHERYLESYRPIWRRAGRRWPASLAANVRKKEFAQVLQQPGALIGFLVFAVLVFGLARQHVLVGGILRQTRLPSEARELAALLTWWFLAVLLVLYTHMGRLALWDGAQWPLYMASPSRGFAILRGKLQAVAVFLLWPLLLVAAVGLQLLHAETSTVLWFCGFAVAGTLAALGIVAIIGTWPRLMRPDSEGQILQGGKSFLAAMVMVMTFQLAMLPAMAGWQILLRRASVERMSYDILIAEAPWMLAAALGYGLILALVGCWVGARNYRRLLAPR